MSISRNHIAEEEIFEHNFHYHKYKLNEQGFDCIILHPRRGKTWQSKENSSLYLFLRSHPLFSKEYTLTKHTGIHRDPFKMSQYYLYEKQFLDEYSEESEWTDIEFLDTDSQPPYSLHVAGFLSQWNGRLQHQFHEMIMRFHDSLRCLFLRKTSTFPYLGKEGIFNYSVPDESAMDCVKAQKADGAKFSPENMANRRRLFGSSALQKRITNPNMPFEVRLSTRGWRWKQRVQASQRMRALFLHQYKLIEDIHLHANNCGLVPYRYHWEAVFTTKCGEGEADGQGDFLPCCDYRRCRKCSIRFAQGAIVVWAAQGVADSVILPYLGAVFRFPKYEFFGLEEWARVEVDELATILQPCSGQGLKACYLNGFFRYTATHRVRLTLGNFTCFFGMQKKSACLLLSTVCRRPFGVPVDRHLKIAFRNLGWVYPNCRDATEMAELVELWLPTEETAQLNNVIAGIRQLVQAGETSFMSSVASRLGTEHEAVYEKLVQDLLK